MFFISFQIFGQNISLGVRGSYGYSQAEPTTGAGIGIAGEFYFENIPFALRIGSHFFSSYRHIYPYSRHDYNTTSIESQVLYTPFSSDIVPYLGIGFGFDFIRIFTEGLGSTFYIDNYFAEINNPQNSFHYSFIAGSEFLISEHFKFFIDAEYKFLTAKYDLVLEDQFTNRFISTEEVALNNIILNLGIQYIL
jgi:hypothetical protein